jgi:hypothetical protein
MVRSYSLISYPSGGNLGLKRGQTKKHPNTKIAFKYQGEIHLKYFLWHEKWRLFKCYKLHKWQFLSFPKKSLDYNCNGFLKKGFFSPLFLGVLVYTNYFSIQIGKLGCGDINAPWWMDASFDIPRKGIERHERYCNISSMEIILLQVTNGSLTNICYLLAIITK